MGNALTMWYDPSTYGFGGGGGEKAARRSEDVARQSEEFITIINQYLNQLVPGSEEYNKLMTFGQKYLAQIEAGAIPVSELGGKELDQQAAASEYGSQLVSQQGARVASGGAATPQQASTNLAFEQFRDTAAFTPEEQAILSALRDEPPDSDLGRIFQSVIKRATGEGTLVEQDLYRSLSGEATTTPFGSTTSDIVRKGTEAPETAYAEQLALLQDQINREANARGLASSGIPIEQLGRAGVELAIRDAEARENIRRTRQSDVLDLFNRSNTSRSEALSDVGGVFDVGQGLRNREIGVEGAFTDLQSGREKSLTDILARQAERNDVLGRNLFQRRTERAEDQADFAADSEASRRAILSEIFGTGIGLAATGGNPAGAAFGGKLGASLAGGGGSRDRAPASSDVASLIAAARTPSSDGGGFSWNLSRKKTDEDDAMAFYRAMQDAGMAG